jgi:hypothetical protein
MDKELIIKNAETLETAARESLHEANAQAFKFSDLLIKAAFAIGGLAATRIVSDSGAHNLLYSRWGLIFLGASVVFGGIQMMIDRVYFRKQGRLLAKATDAWKWFGANHEDEGAKNDAKRAMDELSQLSKTSAETMIYLQITFVLLGVIFALIDVFLV